MAGKKGRSGQKRTPQKILKLHGSWLAKEREDLEGVEGIPEFPEYLGEKLRPIWDETIVYLNKLGILSITDRHQIAIYCKAWWEWREADEACKSMFIKTNEKIEKDRKGKIKSKSGGNIQQHPALSIRNKAWERLRSISGDFGLTPAARTGIMTTKKDKKSDKSRFFNRNSGKSS